MSQPDAPSRPVFPCAVLSVVKHAYVARGVFSHPRFRPVVVADDPHVPEWTHERNQKFADECQVPYVRDINKALTEYGAQVAVVSTEAERHCEMSLRAVQAGLNIVQDKPITTENAIESCQKLVRAVESSRRKFLLWNRNFLPAVQQAHALIQAGEIGKPTAIHIDFYFSKDAGPPKGSSRPGDSPLNWQEYLIAAHVTSGDGGLGKLPMGELEIEGIYPLAYMHRLIGLPVRRVFARTTAHFHQLYADNQVDDLATVTLEMENGVLGTLCLGRIGAASHPDIGEIKLHVLGTKGALVMSEARPEVAVYYRGQPPAEFRNRRVAIDNDYQLMDNFAHAIDTDGETILDARAGLEIVRVVTAALQSGRTGKPVDVLPVFS